MQKKFNKNPQPPYRTDPNEYFTLVTPEMVPGVFDYYMVSTKGRIYHRYLKKFLSPGINGAGYYFVMMSTENGPKPIQIHRIELIAFYPIPNYHLYDVNHKNGNKLDLDIWNLEWMTRQQNIQHAYNTGLHHIGEDNVKATISENDAINICNLLSLNKYTIKEISSITGISESIISSIKKRESWKHVSINYEFVQRPGKLFNEEMIRNICLYFQNNPIGNLNIKEHSKNALISCGYTINENIIDSCRKIYTRKYYNNISKDYIFN